VAQISKAIGPATHNVAEYRALIEGLKLASDYGVQRIRVYMDSELVVEPSKWCLGGETSASQ
jgi:ribonuclease HI